MTIELNPRGSELKKESVTPSTRFQPQSAGEVIRYQQGSFTVKDVYYRGWWSKLGTLTNGLTGRETVVRENVIMSVGTFTVIESNKEVEPLGSSTEEKQ